MNKTMKKFVTVAAALSAACVTAAAQGRFETVDLPHSTLHVYYSNDVMADASYIVEGPDSLVVLEAPLFRNTLAEFNAYADRLGKPVAAAVVNYHQGGKAATRVLMPQGMPAFISGGVYAAMMDGFRQSFGAAMADLDYTAAAEVSWGETVRLAGVDFLFDPGAVNDFPAAFILIDGTACLMHWAPMKAHANTLQVASAAAVGQALEGLQAAKNSGASLWLGSHGGVAGRDDLEFRIGYLRFIQETLASRPGSETLARKLKAAYPDLAGEEEVDALAESLCK